MNKKTVVFSTIIFSLFFTSLLISPEKAKAAIDQRCFTKQECIDAHEDAENPESFFYPAEDNTDARKACGGEQIYSAKTGKKEPAGFCSPEGKAKTDVSFAGTKQFSNLGEFIRFLYRWSVSAGAILAVLVILVSGIQWAISMGKKEVIRKAKKRIARAIAGLALIASSYLILNTINPALVNMRLPQAWMIKAEKIRNPVCKDVSPSSTKIGKAGKIGKQDKWTKREDVSNWFKVNTIKSGGKTTCGNSYYIQNSSQSCEGKSCSDKNSICYQSKCRKGDIIGKVFQGSKGPIRKATGDWFGAEGWDWNWITSPSDPIKDIYGTESIQLFAICKPKNKKVIDSTFVEVAQGTVENNANDKTQLFKFTNLNLDGHCSNKQKLLGFILMASLNESGGGTDEHYLGVRNSEAIDMGSDLVTAYAESVEANEVATDIIEDNPDLLLSKEEIKEGVIVDINVSNIWDSDTAPISKKQRNRYEQVYGELGFDKKYYDDK